MEIEINKQKKDSGLSLKIEDAIQHPLKIVNGTDNDIASALVFTFALIGLPDESIPKGLKKTFLIEFIRSNYKYYSVEEIKTAFIMLVRGDLSDKKPNHYNNFSPEYFGTVMSLYKAHREKACLELQLASKKSKPEIPYEPNSIEKVHIQQEFDLNVVAPIFDKYKQFGKLDLGMTPAKMVYNSLIDYHKIIQFTKDQKNEIKSYAREILEKRKQELEQGRAMTYKDHKEKIGLLADMVKAEFYDNELKTECFKICIIKCFQKMEVNNFKF